jgi:hypothetical protein
VLRFEREHVPPVLDDEPGADEGGGLDLPRHPPHLHGEARGRDGEDAEPERELVHAETQDVDARAEHVAFDPNHGLTVRPGG